MNEPYLIVMGILAVYSIIQISTGAFKSRASELRGLTTFIIVVLFGAMSILSGLAPFGEDVVTYSDATNTRVGNELVITSKFPTQIVSDIKFVDKPVRVKKTQNCNAWGGGLDISYTVELVEK